nr:hypothetical protein [Candidatus Sigynarchaeota archaeon]
MTTILGFVAWTIVVGGLFWTDKLAKADQKYTCPLMVLLRGGVFTLLAYMGLLFWDIVIRVFVFNVIGYGNIHYFIAPLLLAAISGTIFIVGGAFTAPSKRTLVFFGLLVGISIYAFWFTSSMDVLYEPVLYTWGVEFVVTIVWILIRKLVKKPPFEEPVLWDWSAKFKRIFNPKVILGLWVVSFLELLFFLEGYSLFAGFEELNYWLWIFGTVAIAGLVLLLFRGVGRLRAKKSTRTDHLSHGSVNP